jgi:RNA polymerase sigma-70 factor, ECF subfamily
VSDPSAAYARGRVSGDPTEDERLLIEALGRRSRRALLHVVDSHHTSMVRLAMLSGHDVTAADRIVEQTWIDVLGRIGAFPAGTPLKVWIFRLLIARLDSDGDVVAGDRKQRARDAPAVASSEFLGRQTRWPGHWAELPAVWGTAGDEILSSHAGRDAIQRAIDALPLDWGRVLALRDIDDWTAAEVCELLDISGEEERHRLHQARSALRRDLERRVVAR